MCGEEEDGRSIELDFHFSWGSGTARAEATYALNQRLDNVTRIELIEAAVTGVPVTGSLPDYPQLRVSLDGLDVPRVAQDGVHGIPVVLTGASTHHVYAGRVLFSDTRNLLRLDGGRVALSKHDGTPVTQDEVATLSLTLLVRVLYPSSV